MNAVNYGTPPMSVYTTANTLNYQQHPNYYYSDTRSDVDDEKVYSGLLKRPRFVEKRKLGKRRRKDEKLENEENFEPQQQNLDQKIRNIRRNDGIFRLAKINLLQRTPSKEDNNFQIGLNTFVLIKWRVLCYK